MQHHSNRTMSQDNGCADFPMTRWLCVIITVGATVPSDTPGESRQLEFLEKHAIPIVTVLLGGTMYLYVCHFL